MNIPVVGADKMKYVILRIDTPLLLPELCTRNRTRFRSQINKMKMNKYTVDQKFPFINS